MHNFHGQDINRFVQVVAKGEKYFFFPVFSSSAGQKRGTQFLLKQKVLGIAQVDTPCM